MTTDLPSFVLLKVFIQDYLNIVLGEPQSQKMKNFFRLTNQIFLETKVHMLLDKIDHPDNLCERRVNIIYDRDIRESTSRDEDSVLSGLFQLLGNLMLKFPQVRVNMKNKKKFVDFLTFQGLFKKEKRMITH